MKVGKECFCYERQSFGEPSKETGLLEVRKMMEGVKVLLQIAAQIKNVRSKSFNKKRHETASISVSNPWFLASFGNKIVLIPARVCQTCHHLSGIRSQN